MNTIEFPVSGPDKDLLKGTLPLVVAFAEEARAQVSGGSAHYATYTTASGSGGAMDDGQIKDED